MSFKLLTLLQFLQITGLYLFVTVCLPAWVFHKKLSGFSLSARLLFYFAAGNFFVINLVFLLQLLHISNRVTLTLGTAAAAGILGVRNNGLKPAAALRQHWKNVDLVLRGRMGYRTLLLKMRKSIWKNLKRGAGAVRRLTRGRILDILLATGVTGLFFWRFMPNLLNTYGYCASDIILHNYWINALGEGKLFVAGVYPFGLHCLIYYLHDMFGIDNYVLLRIFWIVQTLMVFYSLPVFLKGCCKNRYLPYLGMVLYVYGTLGVLTLGTYGRFFSSLPQVFGMIFILPSVQFLFLFFERKKQELEGEALDKKGSQWRLAGFIMCFALTLSSHFYDTVIVGLFCVGGVLGYGFRLFRKKYFIPVIAAGTISVLIALLPMAAAVAMGTPLQGSLRWGLSIIQGSSDREGTKTDSLEVSETNAAEEQKELSTADEVGKSTGFFRAVSSSISRTLKQVRWEWGTYVLNQDYSKYTGYLMFVLYMLPLAGALFWVLGRKDYGARLVSTGICLWLHGILMASGHLGLPMLMDEERSSIFSTLMLMAGIVLLTDALLYALTGWIRSVKIQNAAALPFLAVAVYAGFTTGIINDQKYFEAFNMNEAVVCLTNIIHENKDKMWTIVSANDETRMADDHGYHYELTDFLQAMEHRGNAATLTLPTPSVYIFIEKVPVNYDLTSYDGSGQSISEEGAGRALPEAGGLGPYQKENRWIIMSRMYYWAQEFQKLYPNELKVYYETDEFVCYYLEQNPYSLYNLAIDYGYNMP